MIIPGPTSISLNLVEIEMPTDPLRDRPADENEIEVTPEMIEAGLDVWYFFEKSDGEAAVAEIFTAMLRAARK